MDTRTDPGQYYPGGRIMVRPDVAPDQGRVIRWGDIQGKPDFSDVTALGAADSLGTVKLTMNTVVNKFKTSLLILFAVCSALADVAPLYTTPNAMPGDAQIMTNTQEYVDAKVAGVPAPGNYAAVSNAAMNAATRNDIVAATNDIPRIKESQNIPGAADYADRAGEAMSAISADNVEYAHEAGEATFAGSLRGDGDSRTGEAIFAQLDAATATNAAQSAAIAAKASTNDVALTPVYGGNGQRFSEWVVNPATYDGHEISIVFESEYNKYTPWANGDTIGLPMDGNADTTSLSWTEPYEAPIDMTATRTENPIIGYTPGSQTDKVLASTNLESGVSAATVTNIVHDLSLGGIWDSALEVWWTPRMVNGSLTYHATTNVNLNAGN